MSSSLFYLYPLMQMKKYISFLLYLFILGAPCFAQVKFQRTHGTGISEYIGGAKPTSDGGYIISLTVDSYPITPHAITDKAVLLKTDSLGNTLWTKTYTKPNYTSSSVDDIIQTLDGGYHLH